MCFSSSACVDKLERAQLFNAAMIVQKTSCPTVQCSIDTVYQKVCNFQANFHSTLRLCSTRRKPFFAFCFCILPFGFRWNGMYLFLLRRDIVFSMELHSKRCPAGFLQAVRSQCLQGPPVLPIQEINQQLFPTRNGIKDQLQIQAELLLFFLRN